MRKELNTTYGKLAKIGRAVEPKQSLALHTKQYTEAINKEMLLNRLRSLVYKSSQEEVLLDLSDASDRETF